MAESAGRLALSAAAEPLGPSSAEDPLVGPSSDGGRSPSLRDLGGSLRAEEEERGEPAAGEGPTVGPSGGPWLSCWRISMAAGLLTLLCLVPAAVFFFLKSGRFTLEEVGGGQVRSDMGVPGGDAEPSELAILHAKLNDRSFCLKEYRHDFGCTHEAKIHNKIGYWKCCHAAILPKVMVFDKRWENWMPPMSKCALVGSSHLLRGKGKGHEIDSHSVVIRINRLSRNGFKKDFGEKASIIMMNKLHQFSNKITLMGKGDGMMTPCDWNRNCGYAGLVFYQGGGFECPLGKLKGIWHTEHHHFIGCPSKEVVNLAYGLKTKTPHGWRDVKGILSTGFIAIMTFAPLCHTLDVYGFGGRATADGHIEWGKHPLEMEHLVERQLAGRHYWEVDTHHWWLRNFWSDWKRHAGIINIK